MTLLLLGYLPFLIRWAISIVESCNAFSWHSFSNLHSIEVMNASPEESDDQKRSFLACTCSSLWVIRMLCHIMPYYEWISIDN